MVENVTKLVYSVGEIWGWLIADPEEKILKNFNLGIDKSLSVWYNNIVKKRKEVIKNGKNVQRT